jgi:putative ABC transport system permease protein
MNNLTYFKVAWNNIWKNKTRAFFTMIAISLAIAILVIMVGAGEGLKKSILAQIDFYGSDVINAEVRVPSKGTSGSATEMATGLVITTFKNEDIEEIRKLNNVEELYTYVTGQEVIKYEGENETVIIFGYGASAPLIEKMTIKEGRFYTEDEEDSLASVIVLGSSIADDLFGDNDPVGKKVYVKGKPFKVVGVMDKRGSAAFFDLDSIVYIPTKTMQKKILGTDYVVGVSLKVEDVDRIDSTKEDIEYLLRDRHDIDDPDEDDFEVATMIEMTQMVGNVTNSINILLIALAAISLLVGGVGITNIMYVTVSERTFEIGLRGAVGASKKDILFQFLAESILLTFLGGILGIILGVGALFLFNNISAALNIGIVTSISLPALIFALIFSTLIGLFFGVYPAKKASQLNPIDAIRKNS